MSHIEVIEQFYGAFAKKDLQKMIECYHPDVEFRDPVFGLLDYEHTRAMWDMLIKAGADLEIYFENVQSEGDQGSVEWGAIYTFSKTGRKVHNRIKADLQFSDGKIIKHTDHFDLWRWTQMAFGPMGFVVGWTPFFKSKLRAQVRRSLLSFMKKNRA